MAYAAALREAVADFTAQGGTQRAIAQAVHIAPATLSRYLSGDRVAPREFLNALRAYLGEQGRPLETDLHKRLDALCGKAHAASGSPAVQLAQLKEELGRLRAQQEQAQQVAETRLAGLEEQADRLARDLEQALERAQSAEGARRLLEDRVQEQDDGGGTHRAARADPSAAA
ncbi:hypothetical protein BGM19_00560 [Streptomyces agglomeratus]|nr:hypothetical protein BGM19_00560 [Streptomyces agglomeratus]